nr:magnesium transporter NIPA2-like [Biomphalaria glabrata]
MTETQFGQGWRNLTSLASPDNTNVTESHLNFTFETSTYNVSFNVTNGTTTAMSSSEKDVQDFIIGLCLAIGSAMLTGGSFVFKKLGLLRYEKKEASRAGQGGLGYLKEWMWWGGLVLMATGEISNFAAYIFAPATLVTPLGALSVIVSAALSDRVLKEKLNILGKVGCVICVLGSTVMVIHSPKEQEVHSVNDLMLKIKEPAFIVYAAILLIIALVSIFYFAPRYGQKNVLVYITICSTLGCFTVMGSKGVGTAINATIRGDNEFTNWMTYVLLAVVIVCILLELNFLNRALASFNTAVVTPILYVIFTSFVITGSAILFKEFEKMPALDIVGNLCGFLVIIAGIFLLNAFKDMKISWRNLPKANKGSDLPETDSMSITGVTNVSFVDVQEIEDSLSRKLSSDSITRRMSDKSDYNDNGLARDRYTYHGGSPNQDIC